MLFRVVIKSSEAEQVTFVLLSETPNEGEEIDTKLGAAVVTRVDLLPGHEDYHGTIVCQADSFRAARPRESR